MNDILKFQSVFFSIQNTIILKNITANFQRGKIICLLGNNGTGKSTFLKLAAGILKPKIGLIEWSCYRRGWLPQNLNRPYNLDVDDFLKLMPLSINCFHQEALIKNFSDEEIYNLFEIHHLKKKKISNLSGGEWKRVQLARLWLAKSELMLLDEPDSDLDIRHKLKLIQICKKYVQQNNATLIITTHDIVFAREVANIICALCESYLMWDTQSKNFWDTKVINKIFSTKVF